MRNDKATDIHLWGYGGRSDILEWKSGGGDMKFRTKPPIKGRKYTVDILGCGFVKREFKTVMAARNYCQKHQIDFSRIMEEK